MGIPRPPDPHGLTKSPAWVDTDEDVMRTYSGAFSSVLEQVRAQLERSRGEPRVGPI